MEPAQPGECAQRDAPRLISSRWPQVVTAMCALVMVAGMTLFIHQFVTTRHINWLLLAISAAHGIFAGFFFVCWKRVRVSEEGYVLSDLIRSEFVSFDDVCLTVAASGSLGQRVKIHFKRRTRFGWCISFVPNEGFRAMLSAHPEHGSDLRYRSGMKVS